MQGHLKDRALTPSLCNPCSCPAAELSHETELHNTKPIKKQKQLFSEPDCFPALVHLTATCTLG